MKKLLAAALSAWLLVLAVPAAFAAEEPLILYTPVAPTCDGVITEEEWGKPDHVLTPGDSTRPEKIEYWFRYKGNNMYFAVRIHTDAFKTGAHDAGGSYLLLRVAHSKGANPTYLGLISLNTDGTLNEGPVADMGEKGCGARIVGNTVEYEFSTKSYATYSDGTTDYLTVQLDFHQPANYMTNLRCDLKFSDDAADIPVPAETAPPETCPPDTAEAPAPEPPADTAPEAPADAPAVLPVILIGGAAVLAAAGIVLAVRKKK